MKIPLAALALVILVSGCSVSSLDSTVTEIVKASPLVQDFLKEYPNAQINARYLSSAVVETDQDFQTNCEGVAFTDYYKVTIEDPDSGMTVMAWVSLEDQQVMCIFKRSPVTTTTIETTTTKPNDCIPNHVAKCYSGHVYWYDSCGNKETKKEYCYHGCEDGQCLQTQCQAHHEAKCYSGHVYWYDSCGNKEEKKQYCEYGCEAGACIPATEASCTDSDSGDNYYVKGTVEANGESYSDHCNDAYNLTEKYCENNEMNYVVYECPYGCEAGACLEETATIKLGEIIESHIDEEKIVNTSATVYYQLKSNADYARYFYTRIFIKHPDGNISYSITPDMPHDWWNLDHHMNPGTIATALNWTFNVNLTGYYGYKIEVYTDASATEIIDETPWYDNALLVTE